MYILFKNDSRFIGRPRTGSIGSPEDSHGGQDYSVSIWYFRHYLKNNLIISPFLYNR